MAHPGEALAKLADIACQTFCLLIINYRQKGNAGNYSVASNVGRFRQALTSPDRVWQWWTVVFVDENVYIHAYVAFFQMHKHP